MSIHPRQRRLFISYAALYLVFAAASARAFFTVQNSAEVGFLTGMLALYLLLLLVEPWLIARNLRYLHGINALQTGIGLALLLTVDEFDFFSLLFIPPCALSILYLSTEGRHGLDWRDLPVDGRGAARTFPVLREYRLRDHLPRLDFPSSPAYAISPCRLRTGPKPERDAAG
jgi:hypothetical protein